MGHFRRLVGLCKAYYWTFKGDCRNVTNIMGCLREGPEAGKGGIKANWGGTSMGEWVGEGIKGSNCG